jgi:hypothetical protein
MFGIGIEQKNDKFLATEPERPVGAADVLSDEFPEFPQHIVAGVVSQPVVDLHEVIDVDGQQRHVNIRPTFLLDRILQCIVQKHPV